MISLPPALGIIANPVSARDIRRVVAHAGNLQISERVNIVIRVLQAARAAGVERVLLMPDRAGIHALLERHPFARWWERFSRSFCRSRSGAMRKRRSSRRGGRRRRCGESLSAKTRRREG